MVSGMRKGRPAGAQLATKPDPFSPDVGDLALRKAPTAIPHGARLGVRVSDGRSWGGPPVPEGPWGGFGGGGHLT